MLIIKYTMNKIRSNDYENKPYPNSFNLMSDTYSVKNNLRFFFFCVYYLSIPETNANLFLTKDEILNIYIKAKKQNRLNESTRNFMIKIAFIVKTCLTSYLKG